MAHWPHFHLQVIREDNLRLKCGQGRKATQWQMFLVSGAGHLIKEKHFFKPTAHKRHMYVVIVRSLLFGYLAINFWGNFFHDNRSSHISHTHYLLCIEWKSNYSVQGNCFIYLQARNCMINPKKITTKIEKAFSNHFSANKINVSQEKYSHYPFFKKPQRYRRKRSNQGAAFYSKKNK